MFKYLCEEFYCSRDVQVGRWGQLRTFVVEPRKQEEVFLPWQFTSVQPLLMKLRIVGVLAVKPYFSVSKVFTFKFLSQNKYCLQPIYFRDLLLV